MNTRVKICGLTNVEDALHAVECGADYLGFILYEKSPRWVDPIRLKEITRALPPVPKVGVFVNETPEKITEIASLCELSIVQLHGFEPVDMCRMFPEWDVWKALPLRSDRDVDDALRHPATVVVADSVVPGRWGGTGETGDWGLAKVVAAQRPLILAGGLGPELIREAVATVHPFGVDVSSGVEKQPGRKDHIRVRDFIHRARTADSG